MEASALRLFRTLRHLRMRQAVHQLRRRLPQRRSIRTGDSHEPAPDFGASIGALPMPGLANDGEAVRRGELCFAGRRESVGFPPSWECAVESLLWRYNLHYHDFLWRLSYDDARRVVLDWMHRVAPGAAPGWDAYPTSLRLDNWCAFFLGRHRARTVDDATLRQALWLSIRDQASHLARNLEWHLLANHLLENAVALAVAGSCFRHPQADKWFAKGHALLRRELPEQILADGGHYERSPMYQCRVLHLLRLLAATGEPRLLALAAAYRAPVENALERMTHPDDEIALLNDSALDIYPGLRTAERAQGPFALPETGYFGARNGADYVICDAGPMGPDYQPGHGHADLFSFELSLAGSRVVVDSGVSTYEAGAMRDYCRSVRAHNTVEVEGRDQAELWAAFRVGRRPVPRGVDWRESGGGFTLSAEHDGYAHLRGSPRHRRCFRWHGDGCLVIDDRVTASSPVRSAARLHFHPQCRVDLRGAGRCSVHFDGGAAVVSWDGWDAAHLERSTYSPRFGETTPNPCLVLSTRAALVDATIRLEKR